MSRRSNAWSRLSVVAAAGGVATVSMFMSSESCAQTRSGAAAGSVASSSGQPGVATKVAYPASPRGDVKETIHGVEVADPYRWLEEYTDQTNAWIVDQNKVTNAFLDTIPQRESIKSRLEKVWNYERFGMPFKEGGKYFYSYNKGLQPQGVTMVADSLTAEPRVLFDPNEWSKDGTVSMAGMSISEDGKYAAYGKSDGGSDWVTWYVRDIATGKDLGDEIKWVKFSGASWTKDGNGFFYSRYDEPTGENKLKAVNFDQKMYYHVVGEAQSKDRLFYQRPDNKEWGFGGGVTEDGKYLIVSVWKGTEQKNMVFVRDLATHPLDAVPTATDAKIRAVELKIREVRDTIEAKVAAKASETDPEFKTLNDALTGLTGERLALVKSQGGIAHGFLELLPDFDAEYGYVTNKGSTFYFQTNNGAPRNRLIAIDLGKPAPADWKEVIPQAKEVLNGISHVGGELFANYMKDASTIIKNFDESGKFIKDIQLPGIGSAGGFGGKSHETETFYSFSSYTVPGAIYRYDTAKDTSELYRTPKVDFDGSQYETKQVFYKSKDGTKIPMFITHKKGLKLDGTNPTLLYGYGGFNIPLTPGFSPVNVPWLEMGGVYAVANLRGGGEYGHDWHQAGVKLKKQNVFDDFISAAEYLIESKYTTNKKLAIQGGSNGGLLVGAVITQRPDLFGAALPAVGVLDMLRFEKFTIGWAWASDYGSVKNADEFKALLAYSPYHNAKPGTCFPPTLITTGDHDDRVYPAHSFKFAAALQHAQSCDTPVLIRIETRAGHGAGKSTQQRIEEAADVWGFVAKTLGVDK
jgi:prolyl oligopeptidase